MGGDPKQPKKPRSTKRESANAAKRAQQPPFQFVNVPLTADEKEVIKREPYTSEDILQWEREMALDGYRVGVTHDSSSDAFTVAFTGIYEERPDWNRCITSRHPELAIAFSVAIYKWRNYCEYGIPDPQELTGGREIFD